MARVNISIPDELKAAMDEAGSSFNWSSVAQDAFRNTLATQNSRKDPTMENQIARLRSERQSMQQRDEQRGKVDGRAWALSAPYSELSDMCEIDTQHLSDYVERNECTYAEGFCSLMGDFEHEFSFEAARPSEAYVDGFMIGAQEILDEVDKV